MGLLTKFFTGAVQFHKHSKIASDVSATLRPYFDPICRATQTRPSDFSGDPYVVGFMFGASQTLIMLLGIEESKVTEVSSVAVELLLGKGNLSVLNRSQLLNEGKTNGQKVALCIHAPHLIDSNSSDEDIIKAKSKLAENTRPIKFPPNVDPEFAKLVSGGTIGSKMYEMLFWDHFVKMYL